MGTAQLSAATRLSCQCFPSWEANKQEVDNPGLWQEAFSDPAVQMVPSAQGPCHQERYGTRTVSALLPNGGVLRASSIPNHTEEPQLGTSGVLENACPFLQVGHSIISFLWVIPNPRAELWPSTLLSHKSLVQVPVQRKGTAQVKRSRSIHSPAIPTDNHGNKAEPQLCPIPSMEERKKKEAEMEGGRLKDKRVARGSSVQRGYTRRSPASLNSGFLHLCQAEPFQLQARLKTLPSGLGWLGDWLPVCPAQGLKDPGGLQPHLITPLCS